MFDEILHWLGVAKVRINSPDLLGNTGNIDKELWAINKAMAIILIVDKFKGQAIRVKPEIKEGE